MSLIKISHYTVYMLPCERSAKPLVSSPPTPFLHTGSDQNLESYWVSFAVLDTQKMIRDEVGGSKHGKYPQKDAACTAYIGLQPARNARYARYTSLF